ncbi:MAG: hypothetical protein KQH79_08465 [Bacteroidetes bacterium]|nr:hypothetical protein [Bacteroidota bacterium]
MKCRFQFLVIIFFIVSSSIAQVPAGFNYQGVLRNSSGELIQNTEVNLRISIIQGSITGDAIYTETHLVTTHNSGGFTLQVGDGSPEIGTFSAIDWSAGPYYIETELDENGGTSYTSLGTVPLLAVPYAMFATDVANKDDADADSQNEIQDLDLTNNILSITKKSSPTHIDLAPFQGNNTDEQVLDLSGTTLSISGGNNVDLSALQDGVDDADNDPANEIQLLKLRGDTLELSKGNEIILPDTSQWSLNGNKLYYNAGNVGVGSTNPVSKLEVKSTAVSGALFQVINANNDTVFAVYPDGVKVFVNPDAKGKVGGFAISGRSPNKAGSIDYMKVTQDSTRIYVNQPAKGKVGGFAISGRSPNKSILQDYFIINEDSTRFYVKDTTSTKGKVGGFAISGRSPNKGTERPFLNMDRYNYFIGHESGTKNNGGWHNSFLGYQAGYNNITGGSNVFLGYKTGYGNESGQNNNYIGYEVGLISQEGNYNNVIGYRAMLNDPDPNYNVIIGAEAARYAEHNFENIIIGPMAARNTKMNGSSIVMGSSTAQLVDYLNHSIILGNNAAAFSDTSEKDIFIGEHAGGNLKHSYMNVFIGHSTGRNMTEGQFNVMIGGYNAYHYEDNKGSFNTIMGYQAGNKCNGDGNVFIGYKAGYMETGSNKLYISNSTTSNPLIKGDFSTGKTTLNNVLNLKGVTEYGASPSEGDIIRLNGHATDPDGLYIYTGSDWQAITTW